MHLEREVGISAFRNDWQKASLSVILTYGLLFNSHEEFFREFELTAQQYNIMRILREKAPKPISTSILRDCMLDKMSDTSRLVSRLKSKGLVEVDRNSNDKRLVNIIISQKGQKLLSVIDEELYRLDNMMQGLTEEEAVQLSTLLEKARTSIRTADKRLAVLADVEQSA